jgi:hypothetical protein
MKKLLTIAFILTFGLQIFGQSKPDIYVRPALYFGGKLTNNKAMNEGAKYATPDKPLEISKSESVLQQNGFYYFSGGYILFLKTPQNMLSTFTFINRIDFGLVGAGSFLFKPKADDKNIIGYSNGVWSIAHRQNIGLKEGLNTITLHLDTGKVINESDEGNNLYQFKVTLKP